MPFTGVPKGQGRKVPQRVLLEHFPSLAPGHACKWQRIAKGAGGKGPRQKTSKIVKKCQKVFQHFSTFKTFFAQGKKTSKTVKKCQKVFRRFSRGTIFSGPFGGALKMAAGITHQGVYCRKPQGTAERRRQRNKSDFI